MSESVDHPLVASWPAEPGTPSLDAERLLWVLVIVVMGLDVLTTAIGLQYGLQEGNTVVLAAIESFGIAGLLLVKVAVIGFAAGVAYWVPDRVSPVIPLGLVLPTLIAVTTNIALVAMV